MKLTNKDITMWISYSFLALFADLPCLYHIDHVWANHPVYYCKNNRGQCSWTDEGRGCYFTLGIMALPQHTAVKRSLCRLSVTMNRSTETYFKAFSSCFVNKTETSRTKSNTYLTNKNVTVWISYTC